MKNVKQVAAYLIILGLLFAPGCNCGENNETESTIPRTGKVKVKPHNDINRKDTYCRYKVTGPPSEGPAAIDTGNIICIYCPPGKNGCDNFSEVEMLEGAVYPVKALDNRSACTDCPKGTDSPPGYPFEER